MNGNNGVVFGVLAYLGPLVIVSWIVSKDDPFVAFHIKQGLALLLVEVVLWFLQGFLFLGFWPLYELINLGIFVLTIIGIVNVVQHKEKELPIVGPYAMHFKI
jgi:uncharacterized membrane protein